MGEIISFNTGEKISSAEMRARQVVESLTDKQFAKIGIGKEALIHGTSIEIARRESGAHITSTDGKVYENSADFHVGTSNVRVLQESESIPTQEEAIS